MDLRKLTYFVAVADLGHIGKAAERLHMSQPPLSRHIQALEAELEVQLFRRTPHGMSVTSAGRTLLGYAKSMLALADHAEAHTRRVAQGNRGTLGIGLYGSLIYGAVPKILSNFRSSYPGVELSLHHGRTPHQIDALRQGRVVVVFERMLPHEPDIEAVHFAREQLWVAMAADHSLSARQEVEMEALADETLLVGSAPDAAPSAVAACRAHGFEPRLGQACDDVVSSVVLAAAGQGVAIVTESILNVQIPGVAYRPLISRVQSHVDLYCFYLKPFSSPLLEPILRIVLAAAAAAGLVGPSLPTVGPLLPRH